MKLVILFPFDNWRNWSKNRLSNCAGSHSGGMDLQTFVDLSLVAIALPLPGTEYERS